MCYSSRSLSIGPVIRNWIQIEVRDEECIKQPPCDGQRCWVRIDFPMSSYPTKNTNTYCVSFRNWATACNISLVRKSITMFIIIIIIAAIAKKLVFNSEPNSFENPSIAPLDKNRMISKILFHLKPERKKELFDNLSNKLKHLRN